MIKTFSAMGDLSRLDGQSAIAKGNYCQMTGVWQFRDGLFMNKPKIIAYLKPSCGWSQGVRAIMRKYDLPFEDRDIINDPMQRQEMIEKSGQMLSPCVEVDGKMLPDISGEEVEAYLLANNLVGANSRTPDAPTNQPCAHEMPQSSPLQFKR
jgi:glutaredoxin